MYRYDVSYEASKLFSDLVIRGSELLKLQDPIESQQDLKKIEKNLRKKYHFWKCKITRYSLITEAHYNSLFK